ncbi:MAG: hypothetical protein ACP5OA_04860 [Candidatus Woesearchaeota archaeon]
MGLQGIDDTATKIFNAMSEFLIETYHTKIASVGIRVVYDNSHSENLNANYNIFYMRLSPCKPTLRIDDEISWTPEQNLLRFRAGTSEKLKKYVLEKIPTLEAMIDPKNPYYC